MAEELRWESLINRTEADADAFGEFRNDTSGLIHIRSIDGLLQASNASSSDSILSAHAQISKTRTVDNVNNTSIFQLNLAVNAVKDATDGNGAGGGEMALTKLFAKGQLTLEPGESIFAHLDLTGVPEEIRNNWTFGYHFE